MKERLVIKNFGPIKSVDLELGKMTILIGEQATGKSTIAKVLAVCRYFSYIADYRFDKNYSNEMFYEGLRYWDIEDYLKDNTIIHFENSDYSVEILNETITETEDLTDFGIPYKKKYYEQKINLKAKSKRFQNLLIELEEVKVLALNDESIEQGWSFLNNWYPSENFFRLNVKKVMDNPFFVPTERGLQSLFSLGRNLDNLSDSLLEQLSQMSKIVKGFNNEISINTLNLSYKNENGLGKIRKNTDAQYYTLHNGASGYQSIIPIEIVIYYYSKIEKRKRTFIIEEPELNLFPKTQKKLMEFFVESINQNGHSFLLPTHSPYLLSSLTNLMYASNVSKLSNGKFKDNVAKIIPEKYWMDVENVAAYYLENGEARNLVNKEEGLLNIDDLDSVSNTINDEFDKLLAIEIAYQNSVENVE